MLLLIDRIKFSSSFEDELTNEGIEMASVHGGATIRNNTVYSFTTAINDELEILSQLAQILDNSHIKIQLFIPSNIKGSLAFDKQQKFMKSAIEFYNATIEMAQGFWVDDRDITIIESIAVATFNQLDTKGYQLASAITIAKRIKEEMQQENVSIQLGNQALLII